MKKTIIIITLSFLIVSHVFCTEVTAGLTYDSHDEEYPVGAVFSLEETFENESSLSVGLNYKSEGAYAASILYNKFLNIFVLSGGLNYDLRSAGIMPGINAGTGIVLKDFSFIVAGGANLNPQDIFRPNAFNCTADVIFDTDESIIDLSFLFSSQETAAGKTTRLGGGLIFTAYQPTSPATIDLITNVYKVTDTAGSQNGISANAGMNLNISLSFMSIHLKTLVDVKKPGVSFGGKLPFSITLSTGFKL